MLTHEILKPLQPYGQRWTFGAPAQQQHQFPVAVRSTPAGRGEPVNDGHQNGRIWHPGTTTDVQRMDKFAYAKYVEGPTVKGRFKVGKLVTIASSPMVLNAAPPVVFLIDHIAEIHLQVMYDADTKEPRCIGIKPKMAAGVVMYPPSKLRPLTEEEEKLVHLRDSEARSTAAIQSGVASAVGGAGPSEEGGSSRQERTVERIDKDTGEITTVPTGNEGYSG